MKRLFALGVLLVVAACASRPGEKDFVYDLPDQNQFIDGGVSTFLEHRCGALDCHGQTGRALRLYSHDGLRLARPDGGARDQSQTTAAEQLENYHSVIGLQPEEMSKAYDSGGAYEDILLLQKPLDIEFGGVRHKGGPVLRKSASDPGWACLDSWIKGKVDAAQCAAAKDLP